MSDAAKEPEDKTPKIKELLALMRDRAEEYGRASVEACAAEGRRQKVLTEYNVAANELRWLLGIQ